MTDLPPVTDPTPDLDELESEIREHFRRHGETFGLKESRLAWLIARAREAEILETVVLYREVILDALADSSLSGTSIALDQVGAAFDRLAAHVRAFLDEPLKRELAEKDARIAELEEGIREHAHADGMPHVLQPWARKLLGEG